MMKKIGIVVNQKKRGAIELAAKIRDWLEKRDLVVVIS